MADINRFAGFTSPDGLVGDPHLSREEKISGLSTWKGMVERLQEAEGDACARLDREIRRALSRLRESS